MQAHKACSIALSSKPANAILALHAATIRTAAQRVKSAHTPAQPNIHRAQLRSIWRCSSATRPSGVSTDLIDAKQRLRHRGTRPAGWSSCGGLRDTAVRSGGNSTSACGIPCRSCTRSTLYPCTPCAYARSHACISESHDKVPGAPSCARKSDGDVQHTEAAAAESNRAILTHAKAVLMSACPRA